MIEQKYEIVKEFECCGKNQDRWETKVDWNRFVSRTEYNKKSAS